MINTKYLSELEGKGLCCYCCEGNRKQLPNCKQEVVNSVAIICSMGKRRQEMLNRGTPSLSPFFSPFFTSFLFLAKFPLQNFDKRIKNMSNYGIVCSLYIMRYTITYWVKYGM